MFTDIDTFLRFFESCHRRSLRDARFHPAMLAGRKVRQLVQLPVKFEIPLETSEKE